MVKIHEICPLITEECDKWLESIGYYEKPASTKYHGCKDGDLYRHSAEVARQLEIMTEKLGLVWEREESPMIVGLLHDVCKCDDYIKTEEGWVFNKNKLIDGHGEKSLIMLMGHIELTEEEKYCILHHMGAFIEKDRWNSYGKVVEMYPNVLYTHTADMIASRVRGI